MKLFHFPSEECVDVTQVTGLRPSPAPGKPDYKMIAIHLKGSIMHVEIHQNFFPDTWTALLNAVEAGETGQFRRKKDD